MSERRVLVYNGLEWEIPEGVTPEAYLQGGLVPTYPDLANAELTRSVRDGVTFFEAVKRTGSKGN